MARRAPGRPAGVEYPFIPDVPGEPVRIILRRPTEAIRRQYLSGGTAVEMPLGDDGKPNTDAVKVLPEDPGARSQRERWLLEQCVVRVEDYEMPDGTPITTGAQLWEHGESEIYWPVVGELASRGALSYEQKKASDDSSHSTPSPTQDPSPGTAASAGGGVSTAHEAAGPVSVQQTA